MTMYPVVQVLGERGEKMRRSLGTDTFPVSEPFPTPVFIHEAGVIVVCFHIAFMALTERERWAFVGFLSDEFGLDGHDLMVSIVANGLPINQDWVRLDFAHLPVYLDRRG